MHFVIAGKINCTQFSYAVMVAQRLKESLPDFTYLKVPKKPDEWEKWLIKICKENEWYHVQSPLIWREVGLKQGKKDLIGDINRFLDLCYDYYGVSREVLSAESFNKEEMEWFKNRTESEFFENIKFEAKKRKNYRSRQICITGASSQVTEIIIMELLQIPMQSRENGLEIRLFDDPDKEKKLQSTANDAKYCPGPSGLGNCRVAKNLKEALTNVDLVIVLDSFGRKPKESLVKWLKRNRNAMCALGKALNIYAPVHCRVIIGSPSNQPICYNATVLASFATKLHVRNIVVVTQDLGREMLKSLAAKVKLPLKDFYCPPVWGFVGLNKFIDVCKTLQKHLYKVPGKRMNSTIPQGSESYELRTSECLIDEIGTRDLHISVSNHKAESFPQLGRWPCLAKATAILDLLRVWSLKQEDGNGEILTLGVYSDGTFNIPQGIFWSQPVILIKGFWVPFKDFPIPRSYYLNCYSLFLYSVAALYRTKVKPRRYVDPVSTTKSKKKKFSFNILEEIGMPVIQTDTECFNHLKYLAKKEIGIDFDIESDDLVEESESEIEPPEEVVREQIYCECWRQELKELQKVIFDRSSSTELEVDLSDNISASEFSVINPSEEISTVQLISECTGKENKKGDLTAETSITLSSSTVCSCGALSEEFICKCLEKESLEKNKTSNEHFYKEESAEIFNGIVEDLVSEDMEEKRVKFDFTVKDENDSNLPQLKFYGKKDAIRDEKYYANLKNKIYKYEQEGEFNVNEKEISSDEILKKKESIAKSSNEDIKDAKFHINIEGVSYDIIGDQDGLENLDEMRKSATDKESSTTFREIYSDEIKPSLQLLPYNFEKSSSNSLDNNVILYGEDAFTLDRNLEGLPEAMGEKSTEKTSLTYLGEALESVWNEYDLEKQSEKNEKSETKISEKTRKREGIPFCRMCRCIFPEGLLCCPCGTTKVVEVFKKESMEVFVENEDDLTFRIELFESRIPPESVASSEISMKEKEETQIIKKDLPPESFFPFSPKCANKFFEKGRSEELTKEFVDSLLKRPQKSIPEKCIELLNLAKIKIEENLQQEERKKKEQTNSENGEIPDISSCGETEEKIKTDFSDLNLFIPDKIEDWRLMVQKKYKEWFFRGTQIRDESYYDIAIEEVSEDEYEVDKELEQYFEN